MGERVNDLDFCILGPLEVRRRGHLIPIPAARERGLLAALLLSANRVVRTDWIIENLWEGAPPATARNTLHSLVYRLRNRLKAEQCGRQLLATVDNGYVLTIADCQLDLNRFEALSAEARLMMSAGRAEVAAGQFRAALSLWRGQPLAGVGAAGLALAETSRLLERYLDVVEDRFDAELMAGRHTEIVAELRVLVAEHPLRERLSKQLMTALYGARRQAEALAVYADLRRVLTRELGIEPDPDLQRLHQAILTHDTALR